MRETTESEMLTELMREAKSLNMLDWPATQQLYAKRDQAIADGLVDEDIRNHMLLVFIERWRKEVEPDMWRENTRHHITILDSDEVSAEVFEQGNLTECPGTISVPITDDVVLQCFHDTTEADMSTLVHFHGNRECIADYVSSGYIETLRRSIGDINVLLIGYRGFGGSTGKPRLRRMLRDGSVVLQRLRLDPSLCVGYGRGLGSIYAIELANCASKLAGVMIESGIADVANYLLSKASPELREFLRPHTEDVGRTIGMNFHQITKLKMYHGRVLIMHAKNDLYLDASEATELFANAVTSNKVLRLYEEGQHQSISEVNQTDMLSSMRRLFAEAFPEKIEG